MSDNTRSLNEHVNQDIDATGAASDERNHLPFGFTLAPNNSSPFKDNSGNLIWAQGGGLLPNGYVHRASLGWLTVSTLQVGNFAALGPLTSYVKGEAGISNIIWSGLLPLDITITGLEGLFSGVETADTWYAAIVLGRETDLATGANTSVVVNELVDSAATFLSDGILVGDVVVNESAAVRAKVVTVDSDTEITLDADIFTASPENYTVGPKAVVVLNTSGDFSADIASTSYTDWRRVGWVRNDSASDLIKFFQFGIENKKSYIYDVSALSLLVLIAGNATAISTISLASFVPPTSQEVLLSFDFENVGGAAADEFVLNPSDSTIALALITHRFRPGILLTTGMRNDIKMITDPTQGIDYAVTNVNDALTLIVAGFEDGI